MSTPEVQAEQAVSFGETPANKLACSYMDKIQQGACAKYHADRPASSFDSIKFWQTPTQDCGNGQSDCADYGEWQQKWTQIKVIGGTGRRTPDERRR